MMRALSIRQPYAELILRGVKTIEFRSRPTRLIGEPFYIYAAKGPAKARPRDAFAEGLRIWSDDLAVPGKEPGAGVPDWMMELAELLIRGALPTGVIVGSATISHVTGPLPISPTSEPLYRWHLTDVRRADELRKPERQPQPAWFRPFESEA